MTTVKFEGHQLSIEQMMVAYDFAKSPDAKRELFQAIARNLVQAYQQLNTRSEMLDKLMAKEIAAVKQRRGQA